MKYDSVYRTPDGNLRLPFANLAVLLRVHGIVPRTAERRAIQNAFQFTSSIGIIASRVRNYIGGFDQESWDELSHDELFLDVQSLFLFLQQYFEDVAFILRMSLSSHQQPLQISPVFTKLSKQFRERKILQAGEPLFHFFDDESNWLEEMKDLRDDICHRTLPARRRANIFPGLIELIHSVGATNQFLSGMSLRSYVGDVIDRAFGFSCIASEWVHQNLLAQHPGGVSFPPLGVILRDGQYDSICMESGRPKSGIVRMYTQKVDDLEFFLST